MRRVRLGVVGVAGLLQEQVRHRTSEGVWWRLGFDDRLYRSILGAEATEKVEYLTRLGDGVADVTKLVGEALEFGAVVVDGQVALLDVAEFSLQKNGALELVVTKVAFNVGPERERRDARLVDVVEDVLGDGGVDPIDDAAVDLSPFGGALGDRRRRKHMVVKAKLA